VRAIGNWNGSDGGIPAPAAASTFETKAEGGSGIFLLLDQSIANLFRAARDSAPFGGGEDTLAALVGTAAAGPLPRREPTEELREILVLEMRKA